MAELNLWAKPVRQLLKGAFSWCCLKAAGLSVWVAPYHCWPITPYTTLINLSLQNVKTKWNKTSKTLSNRWTKTEQRVNASFSVFSQHRHACTMCMLDACWGQKRASGPLELKLWMVVSQYVGAGNQTCRKHSTTKSFFQPLNIDSKFI